MEYVKGDTLQQILDFQKRLPVTRAIPIFVQIAEALEYAHANHMLHRDIKPENVVITQNDTADLVKVLDFGIATAFGRVNRTSVEGQDQVLGTPGYMSPEQAMGGRLDERTDVYSLGCLMYATLAGVIPLGGGTPEEMISRHISVNPVPLQSACPGAMIPANVAEVVMKTLKKFPEDRYSTMAFLKKDLKLLLE
jgi:serine/threonine-protein kinase